jgi:hypothetical protein
MKMLFSVLQRRLCFGPREIEHNDTYPDSLVYHRYTDRSPP